jgi:ABC-2 type transport system permease protein
MNKILATIQKEWILLRRDVAGFMLLFLMPAVLIVVMAMVQDAPFKDYQELRFDLLLADNDHGRLAQEIRQGLKQSKNFHVVDSIDGKPLTEEKLQQLLKSGEYRVGIVVPQGATAEVINAANTVANRISEKIGMGKLPAREMRDSMYVRMYFDPVSKPTFRMSISFALDKYITYSCSNVLVGRLSKLGMAEVGETPDTAQNDDFKKIFQGIGIKEEALGDKGNISQFISSVQHNVPAWAIFGMFFIVIPIAGNMLREREERSSLRIQLIPFAHNYVALGKIFFYTLICTAQFAVMCAIGLWVLPQLGLPALYMGLHPFVLVPIAICIALSATAYGYLVGVVFKTATQATPFGAISVVIMSAMGGIWVPVDLLPGVMQQLAKVSPLHWGLDAINHIILRNGNIKDVLPHLAVLLSFSAVLLLISLYANRRMTHSVQ